MYTVAQIYYTYIYIYKKNNFAAIDVVVYSFFNSLIFYVIVNEQHIQRTIECVRAENWLHSLLYMFLSFFVWHLQKDRFGLIS